jgi:hypothetical protein
MSLAEDTRAAARARPALVAALQAGVVNYTAAARFLSDEVEGDTESVATALRRFAGSLPDRETEARDARVSMRSGLGEVDGDGPDVDSDSDSLLLVGTTRLAPGAGSLTGVVVEGDVDGRALAHLLGRLSVEEIPVQTAGVADETLVVAVERGDGPDALRVVENALKRIPSYERL